MSISILFNVIYIIYHFIQLYFVHNIHSWSKILLYLIKHLLNFYVCFMNQLRILDCDVSQFSVNYVFEYAMEKYFIGIIFYRLGDPKISLYNDFRIYVYRARIFGNKSSAAFQRRATRASFSRWARILLQNFAIDDKFVLSAAL